MKSQAVPMGALDTARTVVEIAGDKQASDIVLLDVGDICGYTDYIVLANGDATRQLDAIADEIVQSLKQQGTTLTHRDGTSDSGWLVLDFSDVVVHIFAPTERAYYRLDDMWNTARSVVRLA